MVLALMLWSGVAAASVPLERYEALTTYNGKIYALVGKSDTNVWPVSYDPSKIVELDADLNVLRSRVLNDGTNAAKNSLSLALYSGKLYVGSVGDDMGGEAGDVWEVDIASWTARQVLDVDPYGVYGLTIANDGTVFLLVGGYNSITWNFDATLYVTTVTALSAGASLGSSISISSTGGYSWGLAWSESDQTLWVMAGEKLQARDKNGILKKTFFSSGLGYGVYSITTWRDRGGLFYTASDYSSGAAGFIEGRSSNPQIVDANLGGDPIGFAFKDRNGKHRVLVRENNAPNATDRLLIYDAGNFSSAPINVESTAYNIHAATTLGDYLYFGTYEDYNSSGNQISGKLIRAYMPDLLDHSGAPNDDGGGGSCNTGVGLLSLLAIFHVGLRTTRKK